MTQVITPNAVRGMTTHRSPEFIAAYIFLQKGGFRDAVSNLPFVLSQVEHNALVEIRRKKRNAESAQSNEEAISLRKRGIAEFFKIAKQNRMVRKFRSHFQLVDQFEDYWGQLSSQDRQRLASGKARGDFAMSIGTRMKSWCLSYPPYELPRKQEQPLWLEYPLYSCSGELEADHMNVSRILKISHGKASTHSRHAEWRHSKHLNFSRDGGGQAETQFHIRPELANVVCKLVSSIGRLNRNGGHIHINCQMDENVGRRVFDSLRYHLSWTRWLVPFARRDNHWSKVDNVQDTFEQAKNVKPCALSANTWRRTGTVEMRLWGTSAKPEDWLGRAALMKAIAKWSEHYNATGTGIKPISNETAAEAWPMFFHWACRNEPEGLGYALKTFRKKVRSSATARLDRQAATTFMQQWEDSGLTCRGYRCRQRVTTPANQTQPPVSNWVTGA